MWWKLATFLICFLRQLVWIESTRRNAIAVSIASILADEEGSNNPAEVLEDDLKNRKPLKKGPVDQTRFNFDFATNIFYHINFLIRKFPKGWHTRLGSKGVEVLLNFTICFRNWTIIFLIAEWWRTTTRCDSACTIDETNHSSPWRGVSQYSNLTNPLAQTIKFSTGNVFSRWAEPKTCRRCPAWTNERCSNKHTHHALILYYIGSQWHSFLP